MYYHIELKNKKNEHIRFYDKNIDFAKHIKKQFYSESDIICEGHKIKNGDKKDCLIIMTSCIAEKEVEVMHDKYPDVLVITNESLFNEYKNIIDEI